MTNWTNLFASISVYQWTALLGSGFLFGVAFTITHFWALKKYIFHQTHFKRALFLLSLVRLFAFGVALWLVLNLRHNTLDVLIFFVAFVVGRWLTFFKTKRMLDNGKEL